MQGWQIRQRFDLFEANISAKEKKLRVTGCQTDSMETPSRRNLFLSAKLCVFSLW